MDTTRTTTFPVLILLTILTNALPTASASEAATYYVDQTHLNATDSNAGTRESAPWLTLQRAMQSDITAGDTVWVKTGTYENRNVPCRRGAVIPGFQPANSGTLANPIAYRVYPGHAVTVARNLCPNARGRGSVPAIGSNGQNYIIWDGFTIGAGNNVDVRNSVGNILEHLVVDRGPITNAQGNYDGIRLNTVDTTVVRNNIVRNVYYSDKPHHNAACYKSYHAHNTHVHNNEFHNCDAGLYDKANGVGNIYEYNYIHDITFSAFDFSGFQNCPQRPCPVQNNVIRNNIVLNARNGVLLALNDPSIMGDISVYNNVLYSIERGIALTGSLSGIRLYNNILSLTAPATGRSHVTYFFRDQHLPPDLLSNYSAFHASSARSVAPAGKTGLTKRARHPQPRHRNRAQPFAARSRTRKAPDILKRRSAHAGFMLGRSVESLSAWRSRGFDLNSVTLDPGLVGPLTATPRPQAFMLQGTSPLRDAGRIGGAPGGSPVHIGAYPSGGETIGPQRRNPPSPSEQ